MSENPYQAPGSSPENHEGDADTTSAEKIAKLRTGQKTYLLCAAIFAADTFFKEIGWGMRGFIPLWIDVGMIAFTLVAAGWNTIQIRKLERPTAAGDPTGE